MNTLTHLLNSSLSTYSSREKGGRIHINRCTPGEWRGVWGVCPSHGTNVCVAQTKEVMKWKSLRRWRCWVYFLVRQENNLRVLGLMTSLLQKHKRELQSLRRGEERRGELCRVLLYCPTHPVRLRTVLLQPRLLLRVQILTHISAWVPFTSYNESDSIRASGHLNIWFSRETRTARIRHFVLRLSNSRTLLVSTSFSRPPHFTICRWLLRKFGLSFLSEVTHYLFWEDIKFFPKKCV